MNIHGVITLLMLLTADRAVASSPLTSVVSILPQSYFVERIGGDKVEVVVMVGPGRSPETYEPTPKKMTKVSEGRLYFTIGVPFEKFWMDRIVASSPNIKVVPTHNGVSLRHIETRHEHLNVNIDSGLTDRMDPHIWLSPSRVKVIASNIYEALSEIDPDHQGFYRKNLNLFHQDLDRLTQEIQEKLIPLKKRRFIVFHPAWGYFAEEFNLEQIPIEIEGKSPAAKTLSHIIDLAKKENLKTIFVQKQFSGMSAQTIADAIGGEVVTIDPLSPDYLNNLIEIANKLIKSSR